MATQQDGHREQLEEEYRAWARICEDKHAFAWPIPADRVSSVPDSELLAAIKRLRVLGRTPHEG